MKLPFILFIIFLTVNSYAQDSISPKIDSNTSIHSNNVAKTYNDTIIVKLEDFVNQDVPDIKIENKIPEASTDYFTPILSILALIFGFVLNKGYDYFQENKKIKTEGIQWIENYIQLINPLEEQISSLQKYIPANDENNFHLEDPTFSISLECRVFETLDEKALVPYFLLKKTDHKSAILLAGKIKNSIEIIRASSQNYKNMLIKLRDSSEPFMSAFQDNFNNFNLASVKYLDYALSTYTEGSDELIEANKMKTLISEQIHPHMENGEFDLFKLLTDFNEPFLKCTYVDRNNHLLKEVNHLLHHCDRNIKAIKMERTYFRIRLEKLQKTYEKQLVHINAVLKENKWLLENNK